jgi:hypothetical protein
MHVRLGLALLSLLALGAARAGAKPIQLSSSVILFYTSEVK